MTLWTDLHPKLALVARNWYVTPGSGIAIVAPAGATILRVSMVGGGGSAEILHCGHGAAFARKKLTVTPAQAFTLQVGRGQRPNGSPLGADGGTAVALQSILTRNSDSAVICRAMNGSDAGPGLASGCVGDVTRSGSSGVDGPGFQAGGGGWRSGPTGGASAGDDADVQALGFGGPGAVSDQQGQNHRAPYPGGGGVQFSQFYDTHTLLTSQAYIPAGAGRACLEWFTKDPGY